MFGVIQITGDEVAQPRQNVQPDFLALAQLCAQNSGDFLQGRTRARWLSKGVGVGGAFWIRIRLRKMDTVRGGGLSIFVWKLV